MSTIIRFECRNAQHLSSRPRSEAGRIVMRHGTFGYCGGVGGEGDHRWVATGGVLLEELLRADGDDRSDEARYTPNANGHPVPLHASR